MNQNVLPRPGSPRGADLAAHHLHQLAADAQPQPGAAVGARGRRVGLAERLEQPRGGAGARCRCRCRRPRSARAGRARVGSPSVTRTVIPPWTVNLTALETQVGQHLLEAEAVADDLPRRAALDERAQLEPLAARVLGQQLDGGVDRLGEVELGVLELELAGLDLRQVEDVVDDRQQRVARRADHPRVAALLLGQLGVEQQLGHPDHAVHRRADLVAHVGQELRLQLRSPRAPRRGRRRARRRAGALDEEADRRADGGQQLAQLLVGLLELVAVELHRAEAAVAGHDRQADRAGQPGRGDRRRARRGGARHQRLGPHRLAGVRHAHRQVLERELADRRQLAVVRAVAPARDRRQLARLLVGQPQRADLPAEVGAERLEQQRRRLLDGRGLREHARDVVARGSSCWPRVCSVMSWNWTKNSVGQPSSSVSAVALTSTQRGSPSPLMTRPWVWWVRISPVSMRSTSRLRAPIPRGGWCWRASA